MLILVLSGGKIQAEDDFKSFKYVTPNIFMFLN